LFTTVLVRIGFAWRWSGHTARGVARSVRARFLPDRRR
jgi:hypothetical protein